MVLIQIPDYEALIWCNQNAESTNAESPMSSSKRYTDAEKRDTLNLVGRIGALTIVESEDPRWSDTFKFVPDSSEEYLIYPLVKKIISYSNLPNTMGTQREIILDPFDVRGRIANADVLQEFYESLSDGSTAQDIYNPSNYQVYPPRTDLTDASHESEYDTFGTQWYKDAEPYGAIKKAIPMNGKHNKHVPLQLTEQKIGYNLYCTVETVGNYYGTSNWNENRANGDYTNDSADYNNYKVQIRPIYTVYQGKRKGDKDTDEPYNGAVDAYMRLGSDYVMINSGSQYAIDYLTCMNNSYYTYEIDTNTGSSETDLDQNMLRHSVTPLEAERTQAVLQWMNQGGNGVTNELLGTTSTQQNKDIDPEDTKMTSLLTPNNYKTSILGGEGTDTKYTYGNSQMLFLRERNRTFIGGDTVALNYATVTGEASDIFSETEHDTMSKYAHAQKWYFEMGLASSTLFVPSGEELTSDNVLCEGFCVCGLDIYANGNPYLLHYQSRVSECDVNVKNNKNETVVIPENKWKPDGTAYKYLIPFSYYDLSETNSSVDIDTKGSH